jgi:hypothetical protein
MAREFVLGIPRCNEPPEIFAATIAAVRANSTKPTKVIIIDNGDAPLEGDVLNEFDVNRFGKNIGCAGAWNAILDIAVIEKHQTTIIINGDCAVTPDTFDRMLVDPAPTLLCGHGFSCFRLDTEIRQRVGAFDEKYYPVYWEDTDYRYRCKLAGVPIVEWPVVEQDRPSFGRARYGTGITHGWRHEDGRGYQGWTGEKLAWFYQCWEKNRDRYIAKWGGMPGEETFTKSFDGKQEQEE